MNYTTRNMYDDVVSSSNEMQLELMEISDRNYYNERQQLLRVKSIGSDKYFDVRLYGNMLMPNPNEYLCIVLGSNNFFEGPGLNKKRLDLDPGYIDNDGTIADMPKAVGFLISKSQELKIADPQNASAAFNISNTNMFDKDKVKVSIAPPINKSYTNNSQKEKDINTVGMFMNENSVLLRSSGGSITLGDEGIHIGGKVFLQGGKQSKDIVIDNPLHGIIPQTIPTAIVSIPQIPNFGTLLEIANTAKKVQNIVQKTIKVGSIINRNI